MKFQPHLRIAFGLLCLALWPVSASAQQQNVEPSLITVTGQAEVQVAPDEAVFALEVEKTNKDLAVAKQQNDESVRQLLALARRFKVAPHDMKTDYISVEMRFTDVDANGKKIKPQFTGYEVSKTVIIRFADLPRFEEFFSEILETGISSVKNVEFRMSQLRKYKDEARTRAIRAAKEKATALTGEIGQTIGRAHSIREVNESFNFSINNSNSNEVAVAGDDPTPEEHTTIALGMIRVVARVSVSFILN